MLCIAAETSHAIHATISGMLKLHTVLRATEQMPQEKKSNHLVFKAQQQKHHKSMYVLGRELIQSSGLLKKSCCSAGWGISIPIGSSFGHTASGLQFSVLAGAIGESTTRKRFFNKQRFYFKHALIYNRSMSPTIDIEKWKCLLNRDVLRLIQFFLLFIIQIVILLIPWS